MALGMVETARRFLKNVVSHARGVLLRKEALRDAWTDLRVDVQKVRATASAQSPEARRHKSAAKLTESGRKSFNKGAYEKAEQLFRAAIIEDPHYALPLAYLGNALHKQGKVSQAVAAWKRAHDLDPLSEGGRKAERSLRRFKDHEAEVVEILETRVREHSGGQGRD